MHKNIPISRKGWALKVTISIVAGIMLSVAAFSSAIGGMLTTIPTALGIEASTMLRLNIENNSDKQQIITLRVSSQSSSSQSLQENSIATVEPQSNESSDINMSVQTGNQGGTTTISLCTSSTHCAQLDPNSLSRISELNVRINSDGSITIVK